VLVVVVAVVSPVVVARLRVVMAAVVLQFHMAVLLFRPEEEAEVAVAVKDPVVAVVAVVLLMVREVVMVKAVVMTTQVGQAVEAEALYMVVTVPVVVERHFMIDQVRLAGQGATAEAV
jgi:hypothetical protein